ncbi:MAG: hypothetical protein JSV65_09545 [Armatimonadota bacterium]|nr:MAG: hypothetical protein JSV65_09545 [Armatimonadota bacterium]
MAIDPLNHLAREDKWYLANGRGAMYAPASPRFLDAPGFWDESYLYDLPLERLFTVLILDERHRPIAFSTRRRVWRPDRLTIEREAVGLECREDRVIVGNHIFASRLTLANRSDQALTIALIQWSLQPRAEKLERDGVSIGPPRRDGAALVFPITVRRAGAEVELHAAIGADIPPTSHTINPTEWHDTSPLWEMSVFQDKLSDAGLPGEDEFAVGTRSDGLVHLGLHYRVEIPPGESWHVSFAFAASTESGHAERAIGKLPEVDVVASSEKGWRKFFDSVPYFECSDPYLTTYYWYRWYGLRLLMVAAMEGNLRHPCIFEGIGGFRCHISYSAQCHMLECSWMNFPSFAEGSLVNFVENQLDSGSFAGHLGVAWHDEGFYHANWGAGALQVYNLFGDKGFLKTIYEPLCRYAEYFARERDRAGSHLYDVVNQGETGQEYASRYLFADPEADTWKPIRLKGVDATVYIYELQRSLGEIAEELGKTDDARRWRAEAAATKQAVRERMWDSEREEFCDVLPGTWERSPHSPAVGFYPFMTDIAGPEHVNALRRHLLRPQRFWTEFPVPTCAVDDPFFSADAEWKGKRHACPWSGRVWPMTNSHACEALARAAQHLDPSLAEAAAELLRRFVRMMFFDGDVRRPNCYEHYNPRTGMPCLYRGVDDYQHSWVVDLIIKYVAGLQPQADGGAVVHPLPMGLEHFTLDHARLRDRDIRITWRAPELQTDDAGLRIYVNGAARAQAGGLERIEIQR